MTAIVTVTRRACRLRLIADLGLRADLIVGFRGRPPPWGRHHLLVQTPITFQSCALKQVSEIEGILNLQAHLRNLHDHDGMASEDVEHRPASVIFSDVVALTHRNENGSARRRKLPSGRHGGFGWDLGDNKVGVHPKGPQALRPREERPRPTSAPRNPSCATDPEGSWRVDCG